MNGVIYVSNSGNTKLLGSKKVDATYASIKASCPSSCLLKDAGCYAQNSFIGMYIAKLDKQSKGLSALHIAKEEARAIDTSKPPAGRDLRLHVSGDSKTIGGTKIINKSVIRWKAKGGGDCWTYTHAWKSVPRHIWSHVSVLASIDSIKEVSAARKQGYAPALVVDYHMSNKAYYLPNSKVKWIPCPAQTKPSGKEIGCTDCRLCFDADRLYQANCGILFAAHGVKKNTINKRLKVIQ